MNDDMDWEAEFEAEWAKIEEAVAPLPLDPSKVGEVAILASLAHPLKDQILERTGSGEHFRLRLMEPDVEAIEAGDLEPVMVQIYLPESEAGEFITVVKTNAASFAAEPEGTDTEIAELGYDPELIEVAPGLVYDRGKMAALVRHVLDHAKPEDRAFALEHPGLDLRPRDDGMIEVLASGGRYLGAFEASLLAP